MAQYTLYITTEGNGTAYAVPNPCEEDTSVTLYCIPDDGEVLEDLDARDPQGYSVALSVVEEQTFSMTPYDLTIHVTFSGDTPTPPTPTENKHKMPLWMMIKRRNDYIKLYERR